MGEAIVEILIVGLKLLFSGWEKLFMSALSFNKEMSIGREITSIIL